MESLKPVLVVFGYIFTEKSSGEFNTAGEVRCLSTPPSFSAMFSKGDNSRDFLLAYLEEEVFPKWGLLLKE